MIVRVSYVGSGSKAHLADDEEALGRTEEEGTEVG
jgi:hypothetical protein